MPTDNITEEKGAIPSNRYLLGNMNNSIGDMGSLGQKLAASMSHKSSHPYGQASIQMHGDLNSQGRSIPNKYPNIKPAISIKPKPVPIAVSMPNKPITTNFDMNSKSTLKSDISLNINTSKKWILPPRPRPGRKPTANGEDSGNDFVNSALTTASINSKPNRNNGKKKVKIGHNEAIKIEDSNVRLNEGADAPKSTNMTNASLHISKPVERSDPNQVADLKMDYLSKLKEQELIRNYIEVINNQINELKFVQNGVITFDALNSDNETRPQKTNQTNTPTAKSITQPKSPMSQYEQLEKINNMNDLNKFLAYLTRSSNIIHSATKKFMGDNTSDVNLNNQIQNYLDIRATYKLSRNQELKEIERAKHEKRPLKAGNRRNIGTNNMFIPTLLKPLNQSIESQDEIGVNIVEEDQNFVNQGDFLDKLIIKDETEEDIVRSNELIQEYDEIEKSMVKKSVSLKKQKSFTCGFCTNDSCLCLDSEIELNQFRK